MKSENKEKGGDIARAFEGLKTTLWSKPKQTMRIHDGIDPVLRTHIQKLFMLLHLMVHHWSFDGSSAFIGTYRALSI